MSVYTKLATIQSELKAPKNQYNSFGRYSYRSAESILEAVKPLLKKHKVMMTLDDEIINIGERYYIKAMATLYDLNDDSHLTVSALARESAAKKGMDDSQITGATSSYARKYCLNGLFLLDDSKDTDTDEFVVEAENRMNKTRESKLQILLKLCKTHGIDMKTWLHQNGKSTVDELTCADIERMIKTIEKKCSNH